MTAGTPTAAPKSVEPKTLRVGVAGLGLRWGIASLAHRPEEGIELVAGADPLPAARARFAERFPDAALWDSFQQMLEEGGLDAVFIATPDHMHEAQAVAALEAGVAIYLEKPMAITVAGCDRILATARATGTKLYVGHNMRHFPVMQKMKQLIDDGAIGEVKTAWCRHFVSYGGDAYYKDWHADRTNTTGLLLQKGAHDIDILHWLCGGYSQLVTAMGDLAVYGRITDRHGDDEHRLVQFRTENWPPLAQTGMHPIIDVEDVSMMLMRLDNGVLASYQHCHFTPDCCRNYTVIGTEGRIENDGDTPGNATVKLWNTRSDSRSDPDMSFGIPRLSGTHGGADPRIVDEFVRYLRTGGVTQTSPVAARMAVAAGCAATESLRNGSRPCVVKPLPAEPGC